MGKGKKGRAAELAAFADRLDKSLPARKAKPADLKGLEKLVDQINAEHQALVRRSAESIWSIGTKLVALRAKVDAAEFAWDDWTARLAVGKRMAERYIQFATLYKTAPTDFALEGPDGIKKLRQLSVDNYIDCAQEAKKDGVDPMVKVIEMQELEDAKAKLAAAKTKKVQAKEKLTKIKKELEGKGPVRSTAERQAQQKEAEALEAELEDDAEVKAAEAELAKVETKRRDKMDPQDFFEALALIGIVHKQGKWIIEDYAAMAFGFVYTSGVPTGAIEKKVWQAYFPRLADVHKRNKAPKLEQQRLEACLKFFSS